MADEEQSALDPTKRRLISYWEDDDTAAIRDPSLIQLSQREFLRGAEAEHEYTAETIRDLVNLTNPDSESGKAVAELVRKRHPGLLSEA